MDEQYRLLWISNDGAEQLDCGGYPAREYSAYNEARRESAERLAEVALKKYAAAGYDGFCFDIESGHFEWIPEKGDLV